jgi:hypothetical protein
MKKSAILILLAIIFLSPSFSFAKSKKFFLHKNVKSTYFWIGQDYGDGTIADKSAWDVNWLLHFGGVDNPRKRFGFRPAKFIPLENPFYLSLPYNDIGVFGRKESAKKIPWYGKKLAQKWNYSFMKNRWVKIIKNKKAAFAQVEDVGPGGSDDFNYVFGKSQPKYFYGIDLSPAVKDYLGLADSDIVAWKFISFKKVPSGPWKEIITTRQIFW